MIPFVVVVFQLKKNVDIIVDAGLQIINLKLITKIFDVLLALLYFPLCSPRDLYCILHMYLAKIDIVSPCVASKIYIVFYQCTLLK